MISKKFKAAVFMSAGLAASGPLAQAHMSEYEHEYNLASYEDFIMQMKLPGGSSTCCGGYDVFVGLQEKENPDGGYTVVIPAGTVLFRDSAGNPTNILSKETVVIIPPYRVLRGEHAQKVCEDMKKQGSKTCNAPPVNMLWANPNTLGSPSQSLYCYWPTPKGI